MYQAVWTHHYDTYLQPVPPTAHVAHQCDFNVMPLFLDSVVAQSAVAESRVRFKAVWHLEKDFCFTLHHIGSDVMLPLAGLETCFHCGCVLVLNHVPLLGVVTFN